MPAWMPIAGAALGGLSGLFGSGDKTTKTTSQLSPYGGDENAQWLINTPRNLYEQWGNRYTPSTYAERAYTGQPQGGGGRGAATQPAQPAGGGGGGGGQNPLLAAVLGGGGSGGGGGGGRRGGGGGGGKVDPVYLKWHADPDQYQRAILEGQNLDVANNPYVQRLNESIAESMRTNLARSMPSLQAAAGGMGRTGSGAAAAQEALAQADMLRNLGAQQSGNLMGAWNTAMGQQTSVLGDLNQATIAGRGNWQQDIANRRTTAAQRAAAAMQAAASRYGSRMGALASMYGSQQSAGASRYGSRLNYQAALDRNRISDLASRRSTNLARQGQRFDQGLRLDQFNRDSSFDPFRAYGYAHQGMMPVMTSFGTQTNTSTVPGQGAFAGALQGALGGGLMGLGASDMFGGGGGGYQLPGNSPATAQGIAQSWNPSASPIGYNADPTSVTGFGLFG